jgi:uncharacterized protein YutE (UPF0331/DUF86 family)
MVVRPELLREKIAALREAVARLTRLRDREPDDEAIAWALERGLQVAAQGLFDAGNHVLAGGFSDRAPDYASVPRLLRTHGVIDEQLEQRLAGLGGFRNLLVHDYARIDPIRVRELLETRLGDFTDFADAVEAWLDRDDAGS